MINFRKYSPDPVLLDYIESYFIITTGILNSSSLVEIPTLDNHPQGTIDMMFTLQGSGIKLNNSDGTSVILSDIFLMAQQEGKFSISFQPDTYIFGVVYRCESFSKFFNFPLEEMTNAGLVIVDELHVEYLELHEQLKNIESTTLQVNLMNQFMLNQLSNIDYTLNKFDLLINHIRQTNGQLSIKDLSVMSNLNHRTLQRNMKKITGVSAKSYSKIIRFNYAMSLLVNGKSNDWQDILFESGYFDQAHFIKDFKLFTGCSPGEFVKNKDSLSNYFATDE